MLSGTNIILTQILTNIIAKFWEGLLQSIGGGGVEAENRVQWMDGPKNYYEGWRCGERKVHFIMVGMLFRSLVCSMLGCFYGRDVSMCGGLL